jgi:hypothetical protein
VNKRKRSRAAPRIEITAEMDVHAVEALALEIRGLARRHGIVLKSLRREKADGTRGPARDTMRRC